MKKKGKKSSYKFFASSDSQDYEEQCEKYKS